MDSNGKRKSDFSHETSGSKKAKPWMVAKKGHHQHNPASIEPGDAGIWATCERGKEGKCTSELRDLFEEYAAKLYGDVKDDVKVEDDDADIDIAAEITKEVQGLRSQSKKAGPLFQSVKLGIQCVLFFKTRAPIEPVEFVHRICKDALEGATRKHRWVKKLTPMTMMGKTAEDGLEKVAKHVLEPVFHAEGTSPKKFAIRPTRRNNDVLKRDDIIKRIARAVGGLHSVDLKNYDHLILVEVYRNILGISVVGSDFEELKQFNLAEIYDPTPKPAVEMGNQGSEANAEVAEGQRRTKTSSPEPHFE